MSIGHGSVRRCCRHETCRGNAGQADHTLRHAAAISLLLGAWAFFNPATATTVTTAADLSQNFENTLLASVDQNDPAP